MPSIHPNRSHLTSADMSMIMRVHASVCVRLRIPIDKTDQFIGNTLQTWEIDGETVSH